MEEEQDEASETSSPRHSDVPPRPAASSYVSSVSSASQNRGKVEPEVQQQETRNTIDFRRNSADSDMLPLTPEHQFVSHPPNLYDSDASDGSIVFSFPAGVPQPGDQKQSRERDRFPSFDSMASNGSFRLTGSQGSSPRSDTAHKSSIPPSPPINTPVQLLPYDQRRKLIQKRQQMHEQQQPIQQPPFVAQSPIVHQPPTPQPFPMPPPPHAMFHPGFQPHHDPFQQPMPGHFMGGGGGPIPMVSGGPIHPGPPQPQRDRRGKSSRKDTISKGRAGLPPSGHARTLSGGASPRNRTASADSAASLEKDSAAPPRTQRSDAPPPPMYPPPPTHHIQHIRGTSSGSISSIGSGGPDPSSGEAGVPPSVEDFHLQNQAFLYRAEYERNRMMQQANRDISPTGRPSSSPRSSRALAPINNDNWEEEEGRQMMQPMRAAAHPPPEYDWRYHQVGGSGLAAPPYPYHHMHRYGPHQPVYADQFGYLHEGWIAPHDAPFGGEPRGRPRSSRNRAPIPSGEASSSSAISGSDGDTGDDSSALEEGRNANERTSLLPPPGISTGEQRGADRFYTEAPRRSRRGDSSRKARSNRNAPSDRRGNRSSRQNPAHLLERGEEPTQRWDNRTSASLNAEASRGERKKGRKKRRKRSSRRRSSDDSGGSDPDAAVSSSSGSFRNSSRRRTKKREKDRAKVLAKWKAEAIADAEEARAVASENSWHSRMGRHVMAEISPMISGLVKFLGVLETFLSNLPLTVGAVALSIVTLGVVWFKFAEENLDSCVSVHFHSKQCSFPEFPGCFYCDTSNPMYRVALNFHFTCSFIAGVLSLVFVAKVILATRVVLDEMSSPTTASPAGLLCMTTVCVFAGRGWIGQTLVSAAAALHLCLAIWFLYICLAYHILPEPSWFPNTVGIGMSAVKTWLYYPMLGHLLMAVSLSLNIFFFPISLIRVTLNKKMSATVCWIQMSAPAVSLYALTIMAQPSFVEEHPDITQFQKVHRMVYLPCMHFLFALACIGVVSSIQSLWVRWDDFRKKAFSPAHAAFCFPTLAHTNAIQAYRAAINSFSDLPPHNVFKVALYTYWVAMLVSGTLATLYITAKFFYHLPGWTQIDVADEEEPPAPYATDLALKDVITTGETLSQPFVSPAVLQANETGQLVMISRGARDGRRRYRRTRQLTALGFEPIMNIIDMDREREVLLDWVGKHPPRRRTQTLSVPGIDFNYGFGDFGVGNTGVYGDPGHVRSSTAAGYGDGRPRSSTTGGGPSPRGQWSYY